MYVGQQKTIAQNVLSKIETIDPYCIIAGGAPRDWYFGNLASDIDIFINSSFCTLGAMTKQLKSLGLVESEVVFNCEHKNPLYAKNPNIHRIGEFEKDGVKFQLIYLKSYGKIDNPTFKCVKEFPLSICKVWYKHGKIHPTKEFLGSVKFKSIIKTNELYADGDKYITKIVDKFPAFNYYSSYEEFLNSILQENFI